MTREAEAAEQALHIHRIRQHLQAASTLVWEKPEFPAAHRPDVPSLRSKIKIGTAISPYQFHPAIKPDLLSALRTQTKTASSHAELTQIAWHNPLTGDTTFSPKTIGLLDRILKPTIYHEAGHSLITPVSIPADQYLEANIHQVSKILQGAFDPKSNITLAETSITKIGFREYLLVDGFFVSDLLPQGVIYLDEIYATAMELITNQIAERGGDIARFDADAAGGRLRIDRKRSHQGFTKTLYKTLQTIDWRYLLDAFKTGNYTEATTILSQHATGQAAGRSIFAALYEAMRADEEAIIDQATKSS